MSNVLIVDNVRAMSQYLSQCSIYDFAVYVVFVIAFP